MPPLQPMITPLLMLTVGIIITRDHHQVSAARRHSCQTDSDCARFGSASYPFECCTTVMCNAAYNYFIVSSGCVAVPNSKRKCGKIANNGAGQRFAATIRSEEWFGIEQQVSRGCKIAKQIISVRLSLSSIAINSPPLSVRRTSLSQIRRRSNESSRRRQQRGRNRNNNRRKPTTTTTTTITTTMRTTTTTTRRPSLARRPTTFSPFNFGRNSGRRRSTSNGSSGRGSRRRSSSQRRRGSARPLRSRAIFRSTPKPRRPIRFRPRLPKKKSPLDLPPGAEIFKQEIIPEIGHIRKRPRVSIHDEASKTIPFSGSSRSRSSTTSHTFNGYHQRRRQQQQRRRQQQHKRTRTPTTTTRRTTPRPSFTTTTAEGPMKFVDQCTASQRSICASVDQECCISIRCETQKVRRGPFPESHKLKLRQDCFKTCSLSMDKTKTTMGYIYQFMFPPKDWNGKWSEYMTENFGTSPLTDCRELRYYYHYLEGVY